MGVMTQHRINNIGKAHAEISRNTASAISQLNAALDQAVKFAAMLDKDPRAEFDVNDKTVIRARFDAVFDDFAVITDKVQDLAAMRTGTPTPDEVLTKYGMTSTFDDYVNSLD